MAASQEDGACPLLARMASSGISVAKRHNQ
jgi:hypothetical protein